MDDIQIRNAAMVGLLSADLARAHADRNLAFRAFDNAGGSTITTAITVPLGTEDLNLADSLYALASNELEVSTAGIYLVQFNICAEYDSGAGAGTGTMHAFLERDTGSGFAAVAGSDLYWTAGDPESASGCLPMRLGAEDTIRLRVERSAGTDTFALVSGGSWLSVVALLLLQ